MSNARMMQGGAGVPIRPAAMAGRFYAAEAARLAADVRHYLAGASAAGGPRPKAVLVPHAGLVYSGPVAAAAYARLRDEAAGVRRVVLIGPSHRVALHGVAVPSVSGFATPLGVVALDAEGREAVLRDPAVAIDDRAHQLEHSLEVQLPFLQVVLPQAALLPLVAGDAPPETVARILERVWGGPETLLVVSTDLSHFLDYAAAQQADARTCRHIGALEPCLGGEEACGCIGLNGFLLAARRHGLIAEQLDLRNSGDTSGDRSRVVGYAAFAFHEPR